MAADFIDLKSPYMGGHSRRCADLAADAARVLGFTEEATRTLRRAALVHDFGTTAVPNSIWDKPGALTRTEFDRVELHPMLTEQMLRRSPGLAALNPAAAAHHEKRDGSGYHKRLRGDAGDAGAGVLAATEIYVGMTTERADRPAHSPADAAAELRRLESEGVIESRACRAVLVAAGHGESEALSKKRPQNPGGLSRARGRCPAPRRARPHGAPDRGSALHLTEDHRPSHPAHLQQDWRLDPRGRRAVGHAAGRGGLIGSLDRDRNAHERRRDRTAATRAPILCREERDEFLRQFLGLALLLRRGKGIHRRP